MAETQSSGRNPPGKPHRPSAEDIDRLIEAHLAEFDAVHRAVRDAAWALVQIVYRLPLDSVLSLIEVAHRYDLETRT